MSRKTIKKFIRKQENQRINVSDTPLNRKRRYVEGDWVDNCERKDCLHRWTTGLTVITSWKWGIKRGRNTIIVKKPIVLCWRGNINDFSELWKQMEKIRAVSVWS